MQKLIKANIIDEKEDMCHSGLNTVMTCFSLQEGKSGRTALHYAVEYGIHRVTKFLLEECPIGSSGVQLEMPTYAGYTAYQLAACIDSALARELADKGALPRSMPEDEESDSDFSDEEVRT